MVRICLLSLLASVALAGLAQPAGASVILDDFTVAQEVRADIGPGAPPQVNYSVLSGISTSSTIGGVRKLFLEAISGAGGQDSFIQVDEGVFAINNPALREARATLRYDGTPGTNDLAGFDAFVGPGLNADLSGQFAFNSTYTFDQAAGVTAIWKIYDTLNTLVSTAVVNLPQANVPTAFLLPFADFDNPGAFNSLIGKIDIEFTSSAASWDFTFETRLEALQVPEPSSLAIAGVGALVLGGVALRRRRRLV